MVDQWAHDTAQSTEANREEAAAYTSGMISELLKRLQDSVEN